MRAAVKVYPEAGGTEIREVDSPKLEPASVLVKVETVGICGTDLHIYRWDEWARSCIKPPLIYGHEFVGEVVEKSSEVSWVNVGDRITGEGHIACGHCYNCRTGRQHICENLVSLGVNRDGAFADYVTLPENNVWLNDPSLPSDICAVQDPLGNAVHTVLSADCVGKDVAVFGLGPIGSMAVAVLRAIGASTIFGIGRSNDYRINLAREIGAHHTIKTSEQNVVDEVKHEAGGVDVVLEMSGNPQAVLDGLSVLRPGGQISLLGTYTRPLTIDLSSNIVFKYVTIKGITGRLMYDTWYQMRGLLRDSKFRANIEKIITHRYKFEDFHKAMGVMDSGNSGKILMYMG